MKARLFLLFFAMTVLTAGAARACPIPVYRYALEFWEPDPCLVTVYYRDGLDDEGKEAVGLLSAASEGVSTPANVNVETVDAGRRSRAYSEESRAPESDDGLPWMVARYPYTSAIDEPFWWGPLTVENARLLLSSPVREEIAEKLASGVMVWVFLESGDAGKDRRYFRLAEDELARLERVLELPDPEQWWTGREGAEMPEIKFELLRLSRNDPDEQMLVRMLLNSERDLPEFESEPILFPLYGRGIALWAIVGKGINAWNITEAAEFLIGPCSCQVKMLNPGVDLLFLKDWRGSIEMLTEWMLPPVTGFSGFEQRGEEARERLESEDGYPLISRAEKDAEDSLLPGEAGEVFEKPAEAEKAQAGRRMRDDSAAKIPVIAFAILAAAVTAGGLILLRKTGGGG